MFLAGIRRLKFAILLAVLSSTAVFGAKFESDTDVKLFNFFANECGNLEIFPNAFPDFIYSLCQSHTHAIRLYLCTLQHTRSLELRGVKAVTTPLGLGND